MKKTAPAGPSFRYSVEPPSQLSLRVGDLASAFPEGSLAAGAEDRFVTLDTADFLRGPRPLLLLSKLRDKYPDVLKPGAPLDKEIELPPAKLALAFRFETHRELIPEPAPPPEPEPAEAPPEPDIPETRWAPKGSEAETDLEKPTAEAAPEEPSSEALRTTPEPSTAEPTESREPDAPVSPGNPPAPEPSEGPIPSAQRNRTVLPPPRRTLGPQLKKGDLPPFRPARAFTGPLPKDVAPPPLPESPKPDPAPPAEPAPPPTPAVEPKTGWNLFNRLPVFRRKQGDAPPKEAQAEAPPSPADVFETPEPTALPIEPPAFEPPEPLSPDREIPPEDPAGAPRSEEAAAVEPPLPGFSKGILSPAALEDPLLRRARDEIPDQEAIQAVFLTEDALTIEEVVRRCARLPGLKACVLARGSSLIASSGVPAGMDALSLSRKGSAAIGDLRDAVHRLEVDEAPVVTLYTRHGILSMFWHEDLCLIALHQERNFIPGVREKISRALELLSHSNLPLGLPAPEPEAEPSGTAHRAI